MKLSHRLTCYLLVLSLWSTPAIGEAQTAFERPDETWLVADITVPTIVDTFALMEVNRWPQAARGIRLAYRTPMEPRASFDVFVYPVNATGGIPEEQLANEYDAARDEVTLYARHGRENIEITALEESEVSVETSEGLVFNGFQAEMSFDREGDLLRSLLLVFKKDDYFIKYRLTHQPHLRERLEAPIQALLEASLSRIQLPMVEPTAP
jgi:hypothetical protein